LYFKNVKLLADLSVKNISYVKKDMRKRLHASPSAFGLCIKDAEKVKAW